MRKLRLFLLNFCLILPFAISSFVTQAAAQTQFGAVLGTVTDQSGARIAGATVWAKTGELPALRTTHTDHEGEFRLASLPPGYYAIEVAAKGFATETFHVSVEVGTSPRVDFRLVPERTQESVNVQAVEPSLSTQPSDITSSVIKQTITTKDLQEIPLAHRSFANIAYLAPMTEPVEPSDPTKARITAVSFAGSSGLNVDLSVDGGDNNDDWIGGFLQNYSPDAIQEFTVRTAQFDADTSRTNGGSVVITTRRGTDEWHGGAGVYIRDQDLNARNNLDNPEPNPKQPFSRQNFVGTLGGPIKKDKLWFFTSFEYVRENASVAYSANSLTQFHALSQLASAGLIPGVPSISVPSFVEVPFRDALFSSRVDWFQSQRSQWFFRWSFDLNNTTNDLVQQAALPSTGSRTRSNYVSFLINNQFQLAPNWLASLTVQGSGFHNSKERNSHLGLALAFPFSANFHTTSGFETFGDNQFVTEITAFPVRRDQQKYQLRYDVSRTSGAHATRFGVNFIHEPVLSGRLANSEETLVQFPQDPTFYVANPAQFLADFQGGSTVLGCPAVIPPGQFCPGANGSFSQNIQRLGFYGQDSWRVRPNFTINFGLRYDTTFGLFIAEGRDQNQNPTFVALQHIPGLPFQVGVPHDYRGAVAPRLGIAYSPGQSGNTVIRAGVGMYYNDLTQNGWVNAFQLVNQPFTVPLGPTDQGALIEPHYHSPYALQASAAVEQALGKDWRLTVQYEHQQGVHQYRRYEYVSGVTLPADAPNVSLFKTDNRSRYDGVSFMVQHHLTKRFDLTAHYTLASASTWGAVVGELFDYVNGVSDVRNPFGPGDHGPSGEDVRHRLVIVGTVQLPAKFEVSTLSQFESARPFTLATPVDLNNDGIDSNDRAVVNGVPTSLDQFRGTPYYQVDMRVSRAFTWHERVSLRPFVEFFNLFNRSNPGNNYVGDISALPTPVNNLANATAFCLNPSCTLTRPITSLKQLGVPAGGLGDFFGPGTTVGIPFAAQFGVRVDF